jgi:hypothetical protein
LWPGRNGTIVGSGGTIKVHVDEAIPAAGLFIEHDRDGVPHAYEKRSAATRSPT